MKFIFKILVYAGYLCVLLMVGLVSFISALVSGATKNIEEPSMKEISKRDRIEALDTQIAMLEQEKRMYQEKADSSYKIEDKMKYNKKVAALNVQIAQKSEKVLKLREELGV